MTNLDTPQHKIAYKKITVDGVVIFYRESGAPSSPVLLLLHGFPSSSRMFQTLIPLIADNFHVIAPDYPGFGHSETPPPEQYQYTFDHIARTMKKFIEALKIEQFSLYMQDYGGPVGFRIALKFPDRIKSIIIQNAVAHEQGLSGVWNTLRGYWKDHKTNESLIVKNLQSPESARYRHTGGLPDPQYIDPDTWSDEYNYIMRPGQIQILLDLYYDYRTNVALYPEWQEWLKENQPPLLVVWGKYDPLFTLEGAYAFKSDVPGAEVHIFEAGHFALDEVNQEIAGIIKVFLARVN